MSIRPRSSLRQWLLIVAIAVGVIGMHSLVMPATSTHHVRQHASVEAADERMDMDLTAHGAGRGAVPAAAVTPNLAASMEHGAQTGGGIGDLTGSMSMGRSGCCPCDGAVMGHPCQAVLGAAPLTVTKAMHLAGRTAPDEAAPAAGGGAASTAPARSPPASGVRFAQLGVWRR